MVGTVRSRCWWGRVGSAVLGAARGRRQSGQSNLGSGGVGVFLAVARVRSRRPWGRGAPGADACALRLRLAPCPLVLFLSACVVSWARTEAPGLLPPMLRRPGGATPCGRAQGGGVDSSAVGHCSVCGAWGVALSVLLWVGRPRRLWERGALGGGGRCAFPSSVGGAVLLVAAAAGCSREQRGPSPLGGDWCGVFSAISATGGGVRGGDGGRVSSAMMGVGSRRHLGQGPLGSGGRGDLGGAGAAAVPAAVVAGAWRPRGRLGRGVLRGSASGGFLAAVGAGCPPRQ